MYLTEQELQKKWHKILDHPDLPAIKDPYRRACTAIMLENQETANREEANGGYLTEATHANQSGAFPAATYLKGYDPVLISLVRRSAPNLIAFDICGVQPMTMPTGLIFALRSNYTSQGGTEALFNEADTDFSGTGTHQGTAPMPQANSTSYAPGTAMTTTQGEALGNGDGTNFAQMAFQIDKVTVTAKTRALKAEYTMEIQQDLKAVHGLDAEAELANILSTEVLAEINREVVRTIYNNAKPGAQYNTTAASIFDLDTDANGRWSVEKFKGLMFSIERDANVIAKQTRRGRGNILMCASDVASALSIAGLLDSSKLVDNLSYDGDTANTFVGVLNGRFKVFVDPYVDSAAVNYYVVGYRGTSPYDAGMFYCPYVPLTMVRAVGQDSFQPKIGFKTRYGLVSNPFANSSGDGALTYDSNCYYRKVEVRNIM